MKKRAEVMIHPGFAAASEMDLATASDIVTDYLSAFGLTAADSEMLVDKMAYAMSKTEPA